MLYIYRRAASEGAVQLSEGMNINCRRLNDLGKAHFGKGVRAGDRVICWGESYPSPTGVVVLNGAPIRSKFEDALRLKEAGVPTVEVSRNQPPPLPVRAPRFEDYDELREAATQFTRVGYEERGSPVYRDCVKELSEGFAKFHTFLTTPQPVVQPEVWLPRRYNHTGGTDLLTPNLTPNYWSRKETLTHEYRLHSFNGKSIRAGRKVPREGVTQHPWIRSYDGGWKIQYDGFDSPRNMRELAHAAVAALNLQFGAVDIGQRLNGTLMVLEVNRAAGLEGGTVEAYARAIEEWVREDGRVR